MADEENIEKSQNLNQRQKRRQEWWAKKRQHTEDKASKEEKVKRKKIKKTTQDYEENEEVQNDPIDSRYILFVGNLSYDCGENELRNHFECCDVLKDVRLLTKKDSGKSKGCAFLEFENRIGQMKALKLHHSTLCERKINVELTCGGGGKGKERMNKLTSKIDKMKEKRKKAKIKKRSSKNKETADVQ